MSFTCHFLSEWVKAEGFLKKIPRNKFQIQNSQPTGILDVVFKYFYDVELLEDH